MTFRCFVNNFMTFRWFSWIFGVLSIISWIFRIFVVVNVRHGRFFCNQGVSKRCVFGVIKHGFVGFEHSTTAIWVVHFGSAKQCFCHFLVSGNSSPCVRGALNSCYLCYFSTCSIARHCYLLHVHWEVVKTVTFRCFMTFSVFSGVQRVEVWLPESLGLRGGLDAVWHPLPENTEIHRKHRNNDFSDILTAVWPYYHCIWP